MSVGINLAATEPEVRQTTVQSETPKQHYNGLLIVGIALLALGLLLVIATCCLGSALFDVSIVAISFSKAIETTALTLAGKLLLIGIVATVAGSVLAIIGNSRQ